MASKTYTTIRNNITFHQRESQRHLDQVARWELILVEIRSLERQRPCTVQIPSSVEEPPTSNPNKKADEVQL